MISEEVKTVDKDGAEWRSGQEILVAIGLGSGAIMGYSGSLVYPLVTDDSYNAAHWLSSDEIFPLAGYPSEPGLYLWKGSIGVAADERDYVFEMNGEFSPATPEDIARLMGKHDPLPEPEDRS